VASPERDDLCAVVWNPPMLSLGDLTECLSVQSDLYTEVVRPYVASELYDQPRIALPSFPVVSSLRMSSPLIIEFISGSSSDTGIVALGMLAYILKNAERLATLRTRIRAAQNREQAELELSMLARLNVHDELNNRLKELEAKSSFQVSGRPIERFEARYRSRERDPRRRDNRGRHR
jgi:hypothetical protein